MKPKTPSPDAGRKPGEGLSGRRDGVAAAMKARPLAFLLTAAGAGTLLALGIFRKEFGEVLLNAVLL